jgi:hypothetical protein
MNSASQQQGEGYEYHLLATAIAVVLMIMGGGKSLPGQGDRDGLTRIQALVR